MTGKKQGSQNQATRRVTTGFLLATIFFALMTTATGQDRSLPTEQAVSMIRGLQTRQLYELAEQFATEQLASEMIPNAEKVDVLTQLLRCKIVQAASSTGPKREQTWASAHSLAREFLEIYPDHPRKLLLEIQDALTFYSQGNLIGQEIAAEIQTVSQQPAALQCFRSASRILKSVDKEIETLLPIARSRQRAKDELNEEQLVNLKNNVQYRLARVNLAKAEMFASEDKLNRLDALQQVLLQLDELAGQTNADVPLWWKAQKSRIKCLRLLKRVDQAKLTLNRLPDSELTNDLKAGLLTERILIASQTGDESNRQAIFDQIAAIERPGPQLSLAVLRWMMAGASRATGKTKAQLQQQAAGWVAAIENAHGAYWGRRAEIVLVGSIQPNTDNPNVAEGDYQILLRQADNAFRKKNYVDAARAYGKAAKFATQSSKVADAVSLRVRQAQCYENVTDHDSAAKILIQTANQFPKQANADAIHLRGCWNFAKTMASDSERRLRFSELLAEQVSSWPAAESTNQARIWLGDYLQNEEQWQQAITTYLSVAQQSSQFLTAAKQIASAADRWYAQSRDEQNAIARKIATQIDDALDFDSIETWSQPARLLLVEWADAALVSSSPELATTDALLQASLADFHDDQLELKNALQLRQIVVAMKQQVEANQLEQPIRELPSSSKLLQELTRLMDQCLDEDEQTIYASAILLVCEKALSDSDAASNRADLAYWQVKRAAAALTVGKADQVLSELKTLADQNPKSLEIQLAYGRELSATSDNPAQATAAMKQWRKLAKRVKPGSDSWYESKFNIVKLMIESGQTQQATKLVDYLKATAPSWSDSSWSPKIKRLINR